MAKGFEKVGGKCVPTSSGLPQRNVYTGGRASTKQKPIYVHKSPKVDVSPRLQKGDTSHGGIRVAHLIGKR
jgi:hypothetical protein